MEPDNEVLNTEPCSICHMQTINEVEYGEFLTKSEIKVHYYCLLFATKLEQQGTNDQVGINRYRLIDIRKYIQKYDKTICTYCSAKGAAAYCTVKNCTNVFHVICGIKNKCLFEFMGLFKTYCHSHNRLTRNIKYKADKWGCSLCFKDLSPCHPAHVIPSCNSCNIGYFHANCLKKYALNAGYDFMCPTCKNKDYRKEAPWLGIYVPDRMALWETPEVISSTQYMYQCDALECKCPSGCKTNTDSWPMIICKLCGTFGIHRQCSDNSIDNYECQSCKYPQLDVSEASPDIESSTQKTKLDDEIETITVSSGPLCMPKKFMDNLAKERLTMFLNESIVDYPIDPNMPEEFWEQWEEHWTN